MLVDPAINLMTPGPDAVVYAYESADPVEALSFPVKGIQMSNFVYPSYFDDFHKAGAVRFDQLNKVNKPFQILAGGYQIILRTESGARYSAPPPRRNDLHAKTAGVTGANSARQRN